MKEDRRIKKSKASLRSALYELMKHTPVKQITVKELCRMADVNRSTFYANYSTIDDLLSDLHTQFFLLIEDALSPKIIEGGLPESTSVEEFLHIIKVMSAENSPLPILLRNNDAHLFERNMTLHFMSRYGLTNAPCEARYSYAYHAFGSFTIISQWIREGMPCPAETLALQLSLLSSSSHPRTEE